MGGLAQGCCTPARHRPVAALSQHGAVLGAAARGRKDRTLPVTPTPLPPASQPPLARQHGIYLQQALFRPIQVRLSTRHTVPDPCRGTPLAARWPLVVTPFVASSPRRNNAKQCNSTHLSKTAKSISRIERT